MENPSHKHDLFFFFLLFFKETLCQFLGGIAHYSQKQPLTLEAMLYTEIY